MSPTTIFVCLHMSRGPELPEATRAAIVALKNAGLSYPEIGAQLLVNSKTARKVYLRWEENKCLSSHHRSGRPKSLDKHDIRRLKAHITSNRETRRQALGEIIDAQNLPIASSTLRRYIAKDLGLGHRIQRRKPYLSPKQKEARLAFAKKYIHWGPEEWHRVVWSDEMSMQTDSNQGRVWVWRYPEEEYDEDCCGATVIPGFRKVKIWAAMRYGKLSNLVILPEEKGDGKINAREYVDVVMDGEMFDFWMEGSEEVGSLMMMEDGAPYHRGCATERRKQLEEMGWIGWGPGTWPSNSPDLNPIENLWHQLKTNIRKRENPPRSKKDLITALQEEWKKLSIETVNKLCDSMPERLAKVIAAKGGTIGY